MTYENKEVFVFCRVHAGYTGNQKISRTNLTRLGDI